MCRVLGAAIRNGTYRAGPGKTTPIPKDVGSRELCNQDGEDKVVSRGTVNIVQPLINPLFDDRSNGFRPGRGRQHALAQAMVVSRQAQRPVWLTTDLKNAFDRVPLRRLGDVLRLYFPAELVKLMLEVAGKKQKRGLRQGNPLSPLLLNIYLHHFLDRKWRKNHQETPLFRTADDLLIACRAEAEAHQAREDLERLLVPAGMIMPRNDDKNGIADLSHGEIAQWLGFSVSYESDGYRASIAERTWRKLSNSLAQAHEAPSPGDAAHETMLGWVGQLGMCYESVDRRQVYRRAITLAQGLAHEEVPGYQSFLSEWRRAHERWLQLHDNVERGRGEIGGSACHRVFAALRRSDGASSGAPSLSFPAGTTVTLHTDGSCDRTTRRGGWTAILTAPSSKKVSLGGMLTRTTNNRAELIAVIKGLQFVDADTPVRIVSDSEYVVAGIAKRLDRWAAQGWRAGSGRHKRALQNLDLWQQLYALTVDREVTCGWVRGHAGHPLNEECDQLARMAMVNE